MIKKTTLTTLWLLLVVGNWVHAQDEKPSILLHNIQKDAKNSGLSVVESWSLVCEHLCRSDLGGAACGPQCGAKAGGQEHRNNIIMTESDQLLQIYSPEFCGALCENGLGGEKCGCRFQREAKNATPEPPNRNNICTSFCNVHRVTLKGCTKCPLQRNPQMQYDRRPSRQTQPPAFVRQYVMFQPSTVPTTISPQNMPLAGPTPDWGKVCEELCRNGHGGVLCKCDLPPFF